MNLCFSCIFCIDFFVSWHIHYVFGVSLFYLCCIQCFILLLMCLWRCTLDVYSSEYWKPLTHKKSQEWAIEVTSRPWPWLHDYNVSIVFRGRSNLRMFALLRQMQLQSQDPQWTSIVDADEDGLSCPGDSVPDFHHYPPSRCIVLPGSPSALGWAELDALNTETSPCSSWFRIPSICILEQHSALWHARALQSHTIVPAFTTHSLMVATPNESATERAREGVGGRFVCIHCNVYIKSRYPYYFASINVVLIESV